MKTKRKHIDKELEELNAEFLLSFNKKEVELPAHLEAQVLNLITSSKTIDKTSKIKSLIFMASGIAASFIIGIFIFTQTKNNNVSPQYSWDNVSNQEILLYIEDDLTNYTEDDLFALVNTESSENFFDNSGITNEFLEEYLFNQLNEEIQLEDLL